MVVDYLDGLSLESETNSVMTYVPWQRTLSLRL